GKQFMPPLDEGSFLFMPTTMPHASIGEALDILHKQDALISSLPEISETVGKLGRVESALDPAPLSMFETVINYHSEFLEDEDGEIELFEFDEDSVEYSRGADGDTLLAPDGKPYFVQGAYLRNSRGGLIPDNSGIPFRLWRQALEPELNPDRKFWAGVNNSDDIWKEIVRISKIPGVTLAPKLQPIATRLIMLQSGMRAPMGIKVKGPDLRTIEDFGVKLERYLKEVPSVEPAAVFADRVVGKPYLEITLDRDKLALYGVPMRAALNAIEIALGGKTVTMTVEGRERYAVRVRYQRELRDNIEDLGRILVSGPQGALIPLEQLSDIDYVQGPQTIKSEDTFLLGYVLFDMKAGYAEVDVVLQAQEYISSKISSGELVVPEGVSYAFAGSYENQLRAEKTLRLVVPLALMIIMLILYLQFRSLSTTLLIFAGVFVAWSGGFIMIWLYGQDWFMNFGVFGANIRDIFQMREIHLSVAVWVGFLALFGIATDNGVVISTILKQKFDALKPNSVGGVRDAVMKASLLRIRPALMTTATTMLALIPVLTSTGRGADIMVPMAIPTFGGMAMALLTVFTVPTIYCMLEEMKLKKST
ncbi:MAG: efflux RND transporter permease subunit, partial [candidate division Zixibacteria bacterium]|nr:efflux RND transporter permease subunit [candidate division Zixibacteria bacterium]